MGGIKTMNNTMKRILGLMLAVAMLLALFSMQALAAETDTYYLDTDGNRVTVSSYTTINSTANTLGSGWYLATGHVVIDSEVLVSGDVKLILEDGCKLETKSILIGYSGSLTIYGQEEGNGQFEGYIFKYRGPRDWW